MDRNYTYRILKCLYEVHSQLGPGLLESIYEEAVVQELSDNGFEVSRQVNIPVRYKGRKIAADLRLDVIVDNKVILELKSVSEYKSVFEKQLYTYLRLSDCELGYVVNFNEEELRDGIHLVYNPYYKKTWTPTAQPLSES
ncbi:MAG: GxxExxY protein [Bacteroidaceae bacterium]|nr:GxxExxY protein [Bacteroidaceae bacterium]